MSKTLTLSRRIPSRTETITALWCAESFCEMNSRFRAIRVSSKNPMDKCFWCKHEFKDGEMMALAAFHGKTNKTLCQTCARELMAPIEETPS